MQCKVHARRLPRCFPVSRIVQVRHSATIQVRLAQPFKRPHLSRGRRRRLPKLIAATAAGSGLLWAWLYDADERLRALSDAGLPRTYQPELIEAYWDAHPKVAVARVCVILGTGIPFLCRLAYSYWAGHLREEEEQQRHAVAFRLLVTELGPTFIKFGQMLSIRPDVLPPAAVYELQKLCDAVPAFPTPQALEVIRKDLNIDNIQDVFLDLDDTTKPIASASLGQVYRCHLTSTGQEIALKVQRPDMLRTVSLDLYILRLYMKTVEAVKGGLMRVGAMAMRRQFDVQLLDTFGGASYLELDYLQEAHHQERMFNDLVPKIGADKLHVPAVYWATTSRKVLSMEFIDGIQLAKATPDVIKNLTVVGVKAYLTQLLDTGFFHSDPHPGNLLVDKQGRLVIIDFGLCASVSAPDTEGMTAAIVHLMSGDMSALLSDAIKLGFLPEDVDTLSLLPVLQKVYDAGQLQVQSMPAAQIKAAFKSQERRRQFKGISRDLNQIFFEYPFTVPEYFALITRALITLEGIALTGDPEFDIFRASYPYARQRAVTLFGLGNVVQILRSSPVPMEALVMT